MYFIFYFISEIEVYFVFYEPEAADFNAGEVYFLFFEHGSLIGYLSYKDMILGYGIGRCICVNTDV